MLLIRPTSRKWSDCGDGGNVVAVFSTFRRATEPYRVYWIKGLLTLIVFGAAFNAGLMIVPASVQRDNDNGQ